MSTDSNEVSRLLARAAAWLLVLGLLTGIVASAAMTGKLPADGHSMLAAHITALLSVFMLLGVGWTMPMSRWSDKGKARIAWAFIVVSYSGWFLTAFKSFLKVQGIDRTGDPANDTVLVLLTVFVVIPALVASVAWALGLSRPRK